MATDDEGDRSPRCGTHDMSNELIEPPAMREGGCPFCERTVVVYEEPPYCPLCACPLDPDTMRPFTLPAERPASAD